MSSPGDGSASSVDARETRRWLIGVGITLTFGLFGVVMAILSYTNRANRAAPATINPAAESASESTKRDGRQRDHRR